MVNCHWIKDCKDLMELFPKIKLLDWNLLLSIQILKDSNWLHLLIKNIVIINILQKAKVKVKMIMLSLNSKLICNIKKIKIF